MKRPGPGRNRKSRGVRPGSGSPRVDRDVARRKGKSGRIRAKGDTRKEAGSTGNSRGDRTRGAAGREAIVRETRAPGVDGQILVAEDRAGERWHVECLGEPVEVGARILFLPLSPESARRGEMVRLVDAARTRWVCILRRNASGIVLTPFGGLDAPELVLSERDSKGADDGMRVLVVPDVHGRKSERKPPKRGGSARLSVRVVEILGKPYEPDSDHRALVWKHRLTTSFTRRSRLEVDEIEATLTPDELDRRVDLRHLAFVTIDPASARDHDDAVYAESRRPVEAGLVDPSGERRPRPAGAVEMTWTHRLWVAIADVSHFVRAGGWIDADARRRGNSFYFPDRCVPMLPERLSSDLCSLREGVDRLAMVVELRIGGDGQVADALFHEAVIRSCKGLSYEEATAWLTRAPGEYGSDSLGAPDWASSLRCLDAITEGLSRNRREAGAITLELPEVEIEIDAEGRPIDARVRERLRAHVLIEEAMLAANRAVARALDCAQRATIHRAHPPPSGAKLAALSELLERLGVDTGEDLAEPGVLAQILDDVKGMPSEERVHVAALRSMSQARYEPASQGHYALRFDHYLHFTSPIRRYADLEVHRALKAMLRDETAEVGKNAGNAERLAIWLSGRERVATEVERDAQALACCSMMNGREGQRFDARVTGATEYGLFVRLESPAASGLVPMRALPGCWIHDPEDDVLIGERSGARIRPGDRISVRLVEVDADRLRLGFALVSAPEEP